MTSRITLFTHDCKPLTELNGVPTTPRNWVLNRYGRAEFSIGFNPLIPQALQKFSEKNFQFGNLVHIEHIPSINWDLAKRGTLPTWTGIILPDRTWDNGVAHVTAYSAEAILAFRAMPYVSVKSSPANVFKEILDHAHQWARNIIIQPGQVDDLPITYPDDLRTNAYDHILKLTGDTGMDWDVTGQINENGQLELTANLYQRKGIDTGLILDNKNTELGKPLLREQGTPSNQVFGYSQASTTESRFGPLIGIHQAAYDDYGPLQLNQVFIGKHDPASVQSAAQAKADERGRPVKTVSRVALDYRKTFDNLAVGNTVTVKDSRAGFHPSGGYGFESQARIVSMDYNDLSKKVPLNIEVI